jgi:ankyrin repeat protein
MSNYRQSQYRAQLLSLRRPPSFRMPNTAVCPFHYAVMEGASRDVVKLLLQMYPASKAVTDKFGRLAPGWYLGAGSNQHVSGELPDPNAPPLYNQKRSTTVIALLLNSKSARTVDSDGRCPLHWAADLLGTVSFPSWDYTQ